jgi:hypothetical protein
MISPVLYRSVQNSIGQAARDDKEKICTEPAQPLGQAGFWQSIMHAYGGDRNKDLDKPFS